MIRPPRRRSPPAVDRARGFTIIELTVVMGLLSVFMMFLINIMFTTTEVFSSGQQMQELAARGIAGRRPVEASIRAMIGPTRESKTQASDARLIVQWEPIGFETPRATGTTQMLRATVRIDHQQERALLAAVFETTALDTLGDSAEAERVQQLVAQLVDRAGFKGRAEMLLLAWPEGDAEGAYLDLRRGYSLPARTDLMQVREFGAEGFDAKRVEATTEVIASGLLHLSYRFASQHTRNWIDGPAAGGPEWVWDSARAGWTVQAEDPQRRFTLDLGAVSATDSTDDVYPRYIEATVVVGLSSQDLPESQLVNDIGSDDKIIQLASVDRLPDVVHDNLLKIGSEWIRFADLDGRTLRGVQRGQRGSTAKAHPRATGVRAGKTEVLMIEVPHARDSWNG
jgi:prepilin-type N-terminal cleavage/methylation domain-containing protein